MPIVRIVGSIVRSVYVDKDGVQQTATSTFSATATGKDDISVKKRLNSLIYKNLEDIDNELNNKGCTVTHHEIDLAFS